MQRGFSAHRAHPDTTYRIDSNQPIKRPDHQPEKSSYLIPDTFRIHLATRDSYNLRARRYLPH